MAPTAASAFYPRYEPTILVSTILYVSWSIFAINIGMANASMSLDGFPFVRSFISKASFYIFYLLFLSVVINPLIDYNITMRIEA